MTARTEEEIDQIIQKRLESFLVRLKECGPIDSATERAINQVNTLAAVAGTMFLLEDRIRAIDVGGPSAVLRDSIADAIGKTADDLLPRE